MEFETEQDYQRHLLDQAISHGIVAIKNGQDGENGKDYVLTEDDKKEIASLVAKFIKVPIVEKIIEKVEVIKEQPIVTEIVKEVALKDTSIEIRDKLETLKGDERLDIEAIKGVGNFQKEIFNEVNNRALSIVDQRTSFLVQKVSNLQNQVNNLSTSSSGTSVSIETPSGTINGSNSSFTVLNTPKFISVDGLNKFSPSNYTYSAGTITIVDGAPPVQQIISFY